MDNSNKLTFLDAISIASFLIGLENLELNITQEDVQGLESNFNRNLEESIKDIHDHLGVQDAKLNHIVRMLEGSSHDR